MHSIRKNAATRLAGVAIVTVCAALAGCSTSSMTQAPPLANLDQLVILPIANYSETPEAGQRVRSVAQSLLHQKGFTQLESYPQDENTNLLLAGSPDDAMAQALQWARQKGTRYALTGSVQEWRYKVGIDGEPVVGVTFNLLDVPSGAVLWSSTGSRRGWSRSSLSGTSQQLIEELLDPLTP
jgi:TolB-like protein